MKQPINKSIPTLMLALLLCACGTSRSAAPSTPAPAASGTAHPTMVIALPLTRSAPPTPTPLSGATPAPTEQPPPTQIDATLQPTQTDATPQTTPPIATYQIVNSYPHDPQAFTQGLEYENGFFYEGTGLNGKSTLRQVEPATGNIVQIHAISETYFGEGITIFGDRIMQLTWQSQVGFIYDKASFAPLGEFHYPTEGWGLTHDATRLIMSDGSSTLHFLDPQTFQETGSVDVYDNNGPVVRLNELEYIHGEIYANVWQTDRIARISPQTGQVLGWIDLTGLLGPEDRQPPVDWLNGIAYDAAAERLFVTGKRWPKLFEIKIIE